MATREQTVPRWDLSDIYPALDSPAFTSDLDRLRRMLDELDRFIRAEGIGAGQRELPVEKEAAVLDEAIGRFDGALRLLDTLEAFTYGHVSTDSYDQEAARWLSVVEQLGLRLSKSRTRFKAWAGTVVDRLDALCAVGPRIAEHRQAVMDAAEDSRHLMEPPLEDLAAELQLSGGGSMWKLQGNLTSRLKMPFERHGKSEILPITVIRNLALDPSEDVRRRAYETELRAWESVRDAVAFALNGVKGSALTLARWRGHEGVLEGSLERNRIDRATLDALLGSIREAFPVFRRYLRGKAAKLGKERLPWWDLFAPVGGEQPTYTWEQARTFIVEQFGRFDPQLAAFADHAFAHRWIDADPRDGKRGGAFCMGVAGLEESRILSNFDGSFDQMVTVAHELGHAWHSRCQKGLSMLLRGAPMTLAETASIFCETIVINAALESASPGARVFVLENQLAGAAQVTVDIYSRFLFESEVLRRRADSELSADDLCTIMLEAQRETYGDAVDPATYHKYMWVMKPHYYQADLNFYNFPYAFGQLFGLGIYAAYREEGASFLPRYRHLLRSTGTGTAADLAARFGIDLRSPGFWRGSLRVIEEQVDRYCATQG